MLIKWIKEQIDGKKNSNSQNCLTESTRALSNPGCGWYHLYSFDLAEESFLYIACEEEALVLLRIDIHTFRSCEQIPKEALDWADRILTFFAQHGKGIILRIVYDTDGHGMEHEPSAIALVKQHMMQLGAVIKAHAGEILVHQGLFVGSWGEMHSSKFLIGGRMEELAITLAQATDGTCPIAVRKPAQLRDLEKKTTIAGAFTLFNDGIFGSETDLGTYEAMARQSELDWQQRQMQRCFCGGEAIGGMDIDWHQAAADLAKMHVSYLNSTYRQELLEDWKAQCAIWNGEKMSGYEYIGRHLGYRFTVTQVSIERERRLLNIKSTVRNTGFANLCEEAVCKLNLVETKENGECEILRSFEIDCDARTWDSGIDTTIEYRIPIPQQTQPIQEDKLAPVKLFLQLARKRDGRILAFANEEYDRRFGVYLLETSMLPNA